MTGFGAEGRALKLQLRATASILALAVTVVCACAMPANAANGGKLPANVADLIAKADQATKLGQPDVAIIYLKNAEAIAPDSPQVHMELGLALLATSNPSEAEREFGTAQQKGEPDQVIRPWIYQAILAQREAQLLLNRYPEPNANDHSALATETLRARAMAQVQLGKPQDAASSLDSALALARTAQNLVARAQLALDSGDGNLADKLTDEAVNKEPTNSGALIMKITLLQRAKKLDAALEFANRLVKADNANPLSLLTRAGVYLQQNQNDKASEDVDAVTKVAPRVAQAIFYRAIIRARQKDARGAWALAQTLPRNFPTSRPDVGIAVGEMAIDAGQRDSGVDILHSTMEAFPQNAEVRIRLAAAYLDLHEIPQVLDTLSTLQNSPDARVQVLLARAYDAQKKYGQSLQSLSKANAAGFGGDALKLRLANADIQEGKFDEAKSALEDLNAKQSGKPEVAGPLVTVLLRTGQTKEALQVANALAKQAPKSPYGPLYVGQAFMQTQNPDGAVGAYTEAIKREPKFVPAIFDRAIALSAKGDYQAAVSDLQSVLAISPKSTGASAKMAQIFEQTGQDDKAIQLLQKAAAANPRDFTMVSALAQFYAERNRTADAMKVLATFLHTSPGNPDAITLQADLQLARGQIDQAIKTYTALQAKYPKSWQASLRLGNAFLKKKDLPAAIAVVRKAITTSPDVAELRVSLVEYDLLAKNQLAASADAQEFVAKVPGAVAERTLASVLVTNNKRRDAEDVLAKSLVNHPDTRTALALSQLLREEGKEKQADTVMTEWLIQHPDDLEVRSAYAMLKMANDKQLASNQFRTILAKDPYDIAVLNDEAWLLSQSNPAQGLDYAVRADKLAPLSPQVRDTLGWIKWRLGQRDQALALLSQAHAQLPKDPEIAYHLAAAMSQTGKAGDAKQLLSSVLADQIAFADRKEAQLLYEKLR